MQQEYIRFAPYMGIIKTERVGAKKVLQPVCTHWIDNDTGEIMTVKEFKGYGMAAPAQYRYGLRMLQQEHILNSVRKEVREFACFLMLMRNSAGGFVRSMDELMTAYALKHDRLNAKQVGDRKTKLRKMVGTLKQIGVLTNERILSQVFMKIGRKDADKLKEEDAGFYRNLKVRALPGCSIDEKSAVRFYFE